MRPHRARDCRGGNRCVDRLRHIGRRRCSPLSCRASPDSPLRRSPAAPSPISTSIRCARCRRWSSARSRPSSMRCGESGNRFAWATLRPMVAAGARRYRPACGCCCTATDSTTHVAFGAFLVLYGSYLAVRRDARVIQGQRVARRRRGRAGRHHRWSRGFSGPFRDPLVLAARVGQRAAAGNLSTLHPRHADRDRGLPAMAGPAARRPRAELAVRAVRAVRRDRRFCPLSTNDDPAISSLRQCPARRVGRGADRSRRLKTRGESRRRAYH